MPYIDNLEEASSTIGRPLDGPVYKKIRTDLDGSEVAVPVFRIRNGSKRLERDFKLLLSILMDVLLMGLLAATLVLAVCILRARAEGPGYEHIEQTEDPEVIALTEVVSDIYPVCPELLQAVVFYESSNQQRAVSKYGDIGYMQINPRWHQDRMDKLGVTDLTDGYSNILVGADLLCELFETYEDPALVLMAYNIGEDPALELYDSGRISSYAENILELSEQLERLHGK